jgi:hypothetical protein
VASFYSEFSEVQFDKSGAKYRTFDLEGVDRIRKIFEQVPVRCFTKIKKEIMLNALRPMYNDIKQNLPIRTGKLVSSVKMRVTNRRSGVLLGQVTTGKGGAQGHLIENGWWLTTRVANLGVAKIYKRIRFIEGKGVFRKALEKHSNQAVDTFISGINEAARQAEIEINGGT